MIADKITVEDLEKLTNTLNIGYPIVLCNPKNINLLSEVFPDIVFTITNYVEEGKIILVNPDEVSKHLINKLKMKLS